MLILFIVGFVLSTSFCLMLKQKLRNRQMILLALVVNVAFFSLVTVIFEVLSPQYFHNDHKGIFSSLGVLVFLFFAPMIAWLNIIIVRLIPLK